MDTISYFTLTRTSFPFHDERFGRVRSYGHYSFSPHSPLLSPVLLLQSLLFFTPY